MPQQVLPCPACRYDLTGIEAAAAMVTCPERGSACAAGEIPPLRLPSIWRIIGWSTLPVVVAVVSAGLLRGAMGYTSGSRMATRAVLLAAVIWVLITPGVLLVRRRREFRYSRWLAFD